ncbi:MAG: glycine zipper family protein [Ruminococcaceae bacterium]|nr:glycine zipper family protein [Oscillospiraceae bacterium]
MDKDILRRYLEEVRLLELDLYMLNRTLSVLQSEEKSIPTKRVINPPVRAVVQQPQLADDDNGGKPKGALIGAGVGLFFGPVGLAAGYAAGKIRDNKIKREAQEAQAEYERQVREAERKYADDLAQYEKALRLEDMRVARESEEIMRFNSSLRYQMSSVNAIISQTRAALDNLYAVNIIYIKYRSLIPISRFCEYLDSGRRTELEGTNGMYDLYEAELMGNQIVGGLHIVNENLDKMNLQIGALSNQLAYHLSSIQQNQVLLYEEVAKSNSVARDIASELKTMAGQQDRYMSSIQESAKLTAANAAITARANQSMANWAEYDRARRDNMPTA